VSITSLNDLATPDGVPRTWCNELVSLGDTFTRMAGPGLRWVLRSVILNGDFTGTGYAGLVVTLNGKSLVIGVIPASPGLPVEPTQLIFGGLFVVVLPEDVIDCTVVGDAGAIAGVGYFYIAGHVLPLGPNVS
jgi:hypothetical protein